MPDYTMWGDSKGTAAALKAVLGTPAASAYCANTDQTITRKSTRLRMDILEGFPEAHMVPGF